MLAVAGSVVDRDPTYALAYAWLANTYGMLTYYGYEPPWEGWSFVKAGAEHALQLNDGLAEAHLARAGVVDVRRSAESPMSRPARPLELLALFRRRFDRLRA